MTLLGRCQSAKCSDSPMEISTPYRQILLYTSAYTPLVTAEVRHNRYLSTLNHLTRRTSLPAEKLGGEESGLAWFAELQGLSARIIPLCPFVHG